MLSLKQINQAAMACELCKNKLPFAPKPIFQAHSEARILIIGQAPGQVTHKMGIPFKDKSGDRLRVWLGISDQTFYNQTQFAILPMAFCFPGKTKTGDAAPLKICSETWHKQFLAGLQNIQLTILLGSYAQSKYLHENNNLENKKRHNSLTENVRAWKHHYAQRRLFPLPHPSPRNNIWLARHPWFTQQIVPALQVATAKALKS